MAGWQGAGCGVRGAGRRAIDWEGRGINWERLRKTGKDWEWLGGAPTTTTRLRDNGTTGPRDNETTRQRDNETTRLRDDGTTRRRDDGTTGRRDDGTPKKKTGILRHSQAFPVVLSRAWQCVAVWRQSGVAVFYRKRECRGIVLKRTAHGTLLFGIGR